MSGIIAFSFVLLVYAALYIAFPQVIGSNAGWLFWSSFAYLPRTGIFCTSAPIFRQLESRKTIYFTKREISSLIPVPLFCQGVLCSFNPCRALSKIKPGNSPQRLKITVSHRFDPTFYLETAERILLIRDWFETSSIGTTIPKACVAVWFSQINLRSLSLFYARLSLRISALLQLMMLQCLKGHVPICVPNGLFCSLKNGTCVPFLSQSSSKIVINNVCKAILG